MEKTVEKLDINPFENSQEQQIEKELSIAIQATKEQLASAKETMEKTSEDNMKKIFTNPSSPAITETYKNSGSNMNPGIRKTAKQLLDLYLTNQFVARAINVRADTLVYKGYKLIDGDEKGTQACQKLIEDSGDINLFWQLSVNTDIAGDGFLEKVYNQAKTKILKLKHVHPLTLEFTKHDKTNKIIIDPKTKEPKSYTQHYVDEEGKEQSKEIPKEKISHLRFNTLGDEFTGVSTIQPGYATIIRLMNMEYSAAEAAIKTANPLIVGEANTRSPHQVAMWGQILGKINGQEQVFVPEGMKLSMLSPGTQNFNDYADYFLAAVVATFGVPKSVLLGNDESGGNRASQIILSRHFYSLIRSNQRYMQGFFNEIFKEYGKASGFKPPKLEFEDIAEDTSVNFKAAIDLKTAGIISTEEARRMIGLEGDLKIKNETSLSDAVKKSDMETWHPGDGSKPDGSQAGVKSKQKTNPDSEVNPLTTK